MTKVDVTELKAGLSEYLRKVQSGDEIVVVDRDTPIARLVPYEPEPTRKSGLVVRPPLTPGVRIQDIPLPPPLRLKDGSSVLDWLIEDRAQERRG